MTFQPTTFSIAKMPTPTIQLSDLFAMLRMRRPSGSKSERRFVNQFLRPLNLQKDPYGNLFKRIGDAPVLWSCHTDTVHYFGGTQHISVRGNIVKLARREVDSNCLGADCTAGVWLMMQMLLAGKPGLYVFHTDEEIGGWGSNYIAAKRPNFLKDISMAIAFDRYGHTSVITHQAFQRCCSDVFALSLAEQLGMGYRADTTGIFTDTANYVDLVPECTNLSVGYLSEHSKRECLDIDHLFRLLDAVMDLNTDKLPALRVPGTVEWEDMGVYGRWMNNNYPGTGSSTWQN